MRSTKMTAIAVSVWVIVAAVGCTAHKALPDPTVATGTSISQAKSLVGAAENASQMVKPHADATGNALIGVVSKEHGEAQAMLDKANVENAAASKALAASKAAAAKAAADLAAVKSGWGYRLQIAVGFVLTLLAILEVLHIGLLIAGLLLASSIGGILTFLGHIINPLGWGEAIIAHVKLGQCASSVSVEVVPAVAGAISAVESEVKKIV